MEMDVENNKKTAVRDSVRVGVYNQGDEKIIIQRPSDMHGTKNVTIGRKYRDEKIVMGIRKCAQKDVWFLRRLMIVHST